MTKTLRAAISENKLLVILGIFAFAGFIVNAISGGFSGYQSGNYYYLSSHGTDKQVSSTVFYLAYAIDIVIVLFFLLMIIQALRNLIKNPPPRRTLKQEQEENKRIMKKIWPLFAVFFLVWLSVVYYMATHTRYDNLSPHEIAVMTGYDEITQTANVMGERLASYFQDNNKFPENYAEAQKVIPEFTAGLPQSSAIQIDKVVIKKLDGEKLPFKVLPYEFSIHTSEIMDDGTTKRERIYYYFPDKYRESKWAWDTSTESPLPTDDRTILDDAERFQSAGRDFVYITKNKAQPKAVP